MADTETPPNPFQKEDMSVNMKIVVDMIEKVVKTPPLKTGDTGRFHIYLRDGASTQTIVLTSAQLFGGPGKFSTLFFDVFGQILFATKKEWPDFLKYVSALSVPGKPEETAAVMAGHLVSEKIATTWEVTDDKSYISRRETCSRLVVHVVHGITYYVVPSAAMMELIAELPIKVSQEDVSQAMTACGMKISNTKPVTPNNKTSVRCWWFIPDKLKELNKKLGDEQ